MKTQFIKDLQAGDTLSTEVYVVKAEVTVSDTSNKFWGRMIVRDKTGEIVVMLFGFNRAVLDTTIEQINRTHFAHVTAMIEMYQGKLNAKANTVTALEAPEDMSDYEISSPRPISEMAAELDAYIEAVKDPSCKQLLNLVVGPKGAKRQDFLIWPAAKYKHHAYRHGLIEHTLEVVAACQQDIDQQAKAGRQLKADELITGAILHDIGKLSELELSEASTEYIMSSKGELHQHISIGFAWVWSTISYHIREFPKDSADHILHMILSHHGKMEWGSPVIPKTPEAHILHLSDQKSATMFILANPKPGKTIEH